MAKVEIIWTDKATLSLFQILDFYFNQNNDLKYGERLFEGIIKQTKLLIKQPFLGKETDHFNIRELVIGRNSIFYLPIQSQIIILLIWDNRQNPLVLFELLKEK
jgi:plasmid stabilization system protein ParE